MLTNSAQHAANHIITGIAGFQKDAAAKASRTCQTIDIGVKNRSKNRQKKSMMTMD
jgi:hypothetical protein